jgi:hypothetical protein
MHLWEVKGYMLFCSVPEMNQFGSNALIIQHSELIGPYLDFLWNSRGMFNVVIFA